MKNKIVIILTLAISLLIPSTSYAQPYGKGIYNANIPYGNETSLSIATSGDVTIPITPTLSGVQQSANNTITVTSTDVKGYKLYIRAINNSAMQNQGTLLPASSNSTPAPLATNTWGYNLDGSANFVGITLSDVLIHSVTTPVPTGDNTTVTYSLKMNLAKGAGLFVGNVVYTAVPQTD